MLDIAQVFAWARMFAGYAKTESIVAAAKETFDPSKPCAICRAVSKARDAASKHGPVLPSASSEKLVLILNASDRFVPAALAPGWPDTLQARALVRIGDVPVPPPRSILA